MIFFAIHFVKMWHENLLFCHYKISLIFILQSYSCYWFNKWENCQQFHWYQEKQLPPPQTKEHQWQCRCKEQFKKKNYTYSFPLKEHTRSQKGMSKLVVNLLLRRLNTFSERPFLLLSQSNIVYIFTYTVQLRGRGRGGWGFTTNYAISAYYH